METVAAAPSKFREAWDRALASDDALLDQLVRREPPGVTIVEIAGHINGMYRGEQKIAQFNTEAESPFGSAESVRARIPRLLTHLKMSRRRLGWRQRDVDITLLRWIRRSSALSLVLGAGISQGAGAPGWADLVKLLLSMALDRGHEILRGVPSPNNPPGVPWEITPKGELRVTGSGTWRFEPEVARVERFGPDAEKQARNILSSLEAGAVTDAELLMRGAQLCADLYGQHMFSHLGRILSDKAPQPSETHRAIAPLGHAQEVPGRGLMPGWESVITYNFDDLMGEAFTEFKIPHAAWVLTQRGILGDPDKLAQESSWHVPIFHLHGYTPRRPFLITDTRFVFSTAQYRDIYGNIRAGLIDRVLNGYLANPVHVALYVGCSFIDQAMNGLLHQAAQRYPGRWHYAILKWPEERNGRVPDADEMEAKSAKYLDLGVQPVWIDDFSEIHPLIKSLQ